MRIRKQTILHTATVLACGNIVLQALGFGYRILLSHFAGAEGLGVYRLVYSAYLVLNSGCLSGVTMACSRLCAASRAKGELHQVAAVLRLAFTAFFALCAGCTAVVLLWNKEIAVQFLGDGRCAKAFPFLLLCLALTGIENILKALFIGLEEMQYAAASEIGEQLVRMLAVGFLLQQYQGNDYGTIAMMIFAGMVVSEVFSALFLIVVLKRSKVPFRGAGPDIALVGKFFKTMLPITVSALISNLLGSAGSVLLPKRLMAAGLTYSQALSALGVISGMAMPLLLLPIALISSVCTALLPAVTAAQAVGNTKRVRRLLGRALSTVGLIGIPATSILIPLAPCLSELFFHQPLTNEYVALLGLVAVVNYYQMTTASLLNAVGLHHWCVVTAMISESIQLLLLYRWCAIPFLGIYGYLFAMILTGAGALVSNLFILCTKVGVSLRLLHRFGIPLLCAAAIYFWTRIFLCVFQHICMSAIGVLTLTLLGAGALYVLILRMMNIRLLHYLSQRMDKMPFKQITLW